MMRLLLLLVCVYLVSGDGCPPPCKCSSDLSTVNCKGKGLHSVPKPFPSTVVSIDLSSNLLSGAENGSFSGLSDLKTLDLSNNKITTVSIDAFTGCGNLTTLKLTGNDLNRLYTTTFYKTRKLVNLDLTENLLEAVPELRDLESLENLYLGTNKLKTFKFPDGYTTLTGLKKITLSNNMLVTSINAADFQSLSHASKLSKLSLVRCKISRVDKRSFSALSHSLSSLRLSQNPINGDVLQTILADFTNSTVLTSLELSSLSLNQTVKGTTFSVLGSNNRLASLNLAGNHLITQIEKDAFTLLKYLTYLTISGTGLTEQPYLQDNCRLVNLDMSSNSIRNVYQTRFPHSLTILRLDGNRITTMNTSPFKYLSKLTTLTLNGNTISSFRKESLLGLESLSTLNLADNILNYLPDFVFDPLGKLVSLKLSNNNIKYINSTVFSKTLALTTLDISGNNLNAIHPSLFAGLQNLVKVDLRNNMLGYGFVDSRLDYKGLLAGLNKLQVIDLSSNVISMLPAQMIFDTPLLDTLNLGSNNIYSWKSSNVFKGSVPLKKLWLNSNKLAVFNETSLSTLVNLTDLDLTNNPFSCNCDMREFRDWLKRTKMQVNNSHTYMCASPPSLVGTYLKDYDLSAIQCLPVWIWIVCGVAAGVILIVVMICICYRCRWKIGYLWYKCSQRCCSENSRRQALRDGYAYAGLDYAAFLSHCSNETCIELVNEDILPRIDNNKELYDDHNGDFPITHRDIFDGGRSEYGELEHALEASASTIAVVCKHYKSSRRSEFELDQSLYLQQNNESRRPIIIVTTSENLPTKYFPSSLRPMIDGPNFIVWQREDPRCVHRLNGLLAGAWDPNAAAALPPPADNGEVVSESED